MRDSGQVFVWLSVLLFFNPVLAGQKDFKPRVEKIVPAIGEQFDLTLLAAGQPEDRFKRAIQLKGSLPALGKLDPFQHMDQITSWLGVLAIVESAVAGSKEVPEAWDLELTRLYHDFSVLEQGLGIFRSAMAIVALQPNGAQLPAVKFSNQLIDLVSYSRDAIRWIASRRLKNNPGPALRTALLEGLVTVNLREGKYQAMQMAAATLCDIKPSDGCIILEAEALFELGKITKGDQLLKRVGPKAYAYDVGRAKLRRQLAVARKAMAVKSTPAAMAKVAQTMVELKELWRINKNFQEAQVIKAAHPRLDEAYIQAAMGHGLDYKKAWAFGTRVKSRSPTPAFLSRRIGAGLMLIMSQFYSTGGASRTDKAVLASIKNDLKLFRKTDARLADLTSIYLALIGYITGDMGDLQALKKMAKKFNEFNRAYPKDLAGVQIIYVLAQLGKEGPDAWQVIQHYRKALGKSPAGAGFLVVYAGAAIKRALRTKKAEPITEVLDFLDKQAGHETDPALKLWRAHLLAAKGLVAPESALAGSLQLAVSSYGEAINAWGNASESSRDPGTLCDAVASVCTLIMQGGSLAEAQGLLKQVNPVCGTYPATAAIGVLLDVADAKKSSQKQTVLQLLSKLEEHLPSHQARIQTLLWLGAIAEAGDDKKAADEYYIKAAKIIRDQRAKGALALLAPDLRSMVAFSGAFNMGVGYSSNSPFGLVIEVTVSTRVVLFPPAIVDEKKMAAYLSGLAKK
ncbi:MAG: hypothetical protein JRJ87_02040 [Deltaproteobacteria bacterium]|nr:hypothetical protein [Deltaproteobacteria bacterium]